MSERFCDTFLAKKACDRSAHPSAEELFRKAIKKNPRNIEAITGLGWTYQLAGEKKTAEDGKKSDVKEEVVLAEEQKREDAEKSDVKVSLVE